MRDDFIYPRIELDVPLSDTLLEDIGKLLHKETLAPYIEKQKEIIAQDELWQYARLNFKNEDGSPWEMSPGEFYIYKLIVRREEPRSQIVSATQWGKSLTVSRALLTRITAFPEEWLVVPPDTKRGRKIIDYIIQDTANNEYFSNKLIGFDPKQKSKLHRLLEERSKARLTFEIYGDDKNPQYGVVQLINTSAKFKQVALESIMGFGGRNVIGEESALIDDEVEAGIFRMLAGKGSDTFYLKIGNAFHRNHFLKSWKDPRYKKIFINDLIGLLEERYTEEFLEEAKAKPRYSVLFGGKFPDQSEQDAKGWINLLTDEEVRIAMQDSIHFGEERIGGDVADSGSNNSVIVKRSAGFAEIALSKNQIDTMDFSGQLVLNTMDTNAKKVYIDGNGVGAGVVARVREVNRINHENQMRVTNVNSSHKALNDDQFINKRAEMFWSVRKWIKSGGKLSKDDAWYQLCDVKYKTADSSGKIKMMSKEDMQREGVDSPDIADALAMTFYDPDVSKTVSQDDKFFMKKMQEKQQKSIKGNKPLRMVPH